MQPSLADSFLKDLEDLSSENHSDDAQDPLDEEMNVPAPTA